MANKVRYLTISRVAVELVCSLSDKENKQFNKILFSCFQQLESGQTPEYTDTSSEVLNIALREAVTELETGYKNYSQRVNARKKTSSEQGTESPINHRLVTDESPIDRRPTIEEKRKEEKRKDEKRAEGMQGESEQLLVAWARGVLSNAQFRELEKYLSDGGDAEQARIALHRWQDNGNNGFFTDYLERS